MRKLAKFASDLLISEDIETSISGLAHTLIEKLLFTFRYMPTQGVEKGFLESIVILSFSILCRRLAGLGERNTTNADPAGSHCLGIRTLSSTNSYTSTGLISRVSGSHSSGRLSCTRKVTTTSSLRRRRLATK